MNLIRYTYYISWISLLLIGCQGTPQAREEQSSKYLIEVSELANIINQDSIIVLDLRTPEKYAQNHIPQSINLWRDEIQSSSYPYQGMIMQKNELEEVLGSKGIESNKHLVLYDDKGSCEAARLWWMLYYYGYEKMTILNGGFQAWSHVETLSSVINSAKKTRFELPNKSRENTLIDLAQLIDYKRDMLLLDTRNKEEFNGAILKSGATKKGRIPGSMHMDWIHAIDPVSMKFRSREELDSIFGSLITSDQTIVTYCHSGVRSSHTFFILSELLGYKNVRNFDGSWVEWSYHDLPVELDTLMQ